MPELEVLPLCTVQLNWSDVLWVQPQSPVSKEQRSICTKDEYLPTAHAMQVLAPVAEPVFVVEP